MQGKRYCPNCGAEIYGGTGFCGKCGAAVMPTPSEGMPMPGPIAPEKKKDAGIAIIIIPAIIVAVLAIAIFIVSFGKFSSNDDGGENTEKVTKTEKTEESTDSTSEVKKEDMGKENVISQEETNDFEDSETEESISYEKGVISGDTYKSEFIGLKYTAPEDWSMASEEDLEDMKIEGGEYEMMSVGEDGAKNVIVMTEKLAYSFVKEETYKNSLKSLMLENDGYTIENDGEESAKIGGEKYQIITFNVSANGAKFYQRYYFRKVDDQMVGIIVTAKDKSEFEEILKPFRKY